MGADNTFGEKHFNPIKNHTLGMSEMKHTPEPWEAKKEFGHWAIIEPKESDHWSTTYIARNIEQGHDMGESDAKRIVECVNALAGVENPKEYTETILNQREELAEQVDLLQKGMEFWMKQREELEDKVKKLTEALDQANGYIERNSVGL